jgi:hypothetical protein
VGAASLALRFRVSPFIFFAKDKSQKKEQQSPPFFAILDNREEQNEKS